ncbi:hypothetical protein K7W03_01035 [Sphingobium sp. PNB]|uniref:hypothetical protein n=1 Tax=Sphingobium sp. PNB TaxID=863934 RepID=UPI001CA4201A|nr:hypothetical protein [Sphingobium sp. PNB]MCB4858170.1 hypothetical protein [Sphingobium sp. PNB]
MIYEGQHLSGSIELDGNSFIRCSFVHAALIYRGGEPPRLVDCSFDPACIEFQGAAANTMRLLGAMSQPGSGLRYFAARTLWEILDCSGSSIAVAGEAGLPSV